MLKTIFCTKLSFAATVIGSSGFHHGFHTGIVNIPSNVFTKWIEQIMTENASNTSENDVILLWSTIISIFSVGAILGACFVAVFPDKWGRKRSLFWNNIVTLLSIVIMTSSKKMESLKLLILGRFFSGVNVGLNIGICQIYLTEIAPDDIRGAIACFYYLFLCIGFFMSDVTALMLGTLDHWHFMFLVPFMSVLFQAISLPFCPESPRYLLMDLDDEERVIKALVWLRGTTEIEEELNKLKTEDNLIQQMRHFAVKHIFTRPSLRKCLMICVGLNLGQQLCGIKSFSVFSATMLEDISVASKLGNIAIMTIGFFFILCTVVMILIIDTIGRRFLLLFSFFGMFILALLLSFILIKASENDSSEYMKYLAMVFSVIFVVPFMLGVGPIAMFITAEMFNYRSRAVAVSIAVGSNWFATFLVGLAYLPLKNIIGYYIVLIFIVLNLFFFCFIFHIPETSKLSAIEIIELCNK